MLIVLFLVSHFNFLFVPRGELSWLPVRFLLHVKYTLSYRIESTQTERTSGKAKISTKSDPEIRVHADFRTNLYLDPDVCCIVPKMFWRQSFRQVP